MEMSVDEDNAAAAGVFFGGRCGRSHRNHVCLCGDYLRQGLAEACAALSAPLRRVCAAAPCADPDFRAIAQPAQKPDSGH